MERKAAKEQVQMGVLALCLGIASGTLVWCFLWLLSAGKALLWEKLPEAIGVDFLPLLLCPLGGLLLGLARRHFGDYPDELPVILRHIKKDRHYDYHPFGGMALCALLPLILGASVGPEAGLTGLTAALCYWVGDNLKYAKAHEALFAQLGTAVGLGHLFQLPLFGVFAVEEAEAHGGEEEGGAGVFPRSGKILLYALSLGGGYLSMRLLGHLFGEVAQGFPSFDSLSVSGADLGLLLLYLPVGLLLYLWMRLGEKGCGGLARHLPPLLGEVLAGLAVGITAMLAPLLLFSGEEALGELPEALGERSPGILMGIAALKILLTVLCLRMGMKGGHFFPLIFACSAMGFGVAGLFFPAEAGSEWLSHAVFAAACITATTLGAQMRKPLAVTMLLFLCFPFRSAFFTFLSAAAGARIARLLDHKAKGDPSHETNTATMDAHS